MDDQTRGETPGSGPGLDVPLKRDRKRLRSSEPSPGPSAAPAAPPAPQPSVRAEEAREPELTPVEELFSGRWPASPSAPATAPMPTPATQAPPADRPPHDGQDADEAGQPADDAKPAGRLLGFLRPRDVVVGRPSETVSPGTVPPQTVPPDREPTGPYLPPGGFSGPGHPRLGPLAPVPAAPHAGLARLDVAALVTAVILPPIGLITAIVALIRGRQLRGWGSDLARAAISVALVMTVVFASVGAYIWASETEKAEQLAALKADQRAHALVEVASEPFCGVLAAHPTLYSTADPDYGWPASDAPEGYNAAIANYAAVWAELAAVAPEGIAAETAAISDRVANVVNVANALGSSNRAGDLLGLHAQTDLATVESWYVEYCDVPETPVE